MKRFSMVLLAAAMSQLSIGAHAAPTVEEIKKLGTVLTPWGAEAGANADGSIPAYSGGLTTPPATYEKSNPGWRPDPFPQDKAKFSIDSKNMDQYADKLSEGVKAMMKRYPTFRVDVFETRRTAAFPESVLENSVKNASRCKLAENNMGLNDECRGGYPFPIPKNGYEVMWNKNAHYRGVAQIAEEIPIYVKPNGEVVTTAKNDHYMEWGLYNPSNPPWYYANRQEYTFPARSAGQVTVYYDSLKNQDRPSWTYAPATRRVRLAPDLAADTPIAPLGGAMVYDDAYMFSGKMDRFDFQLVGKKEMFIPANGYRLHYPDKGSACEGNAKFTPNHVKPECVRFELRRVWHVKATLKEGKRHVYKSRDFYIDEDAWYGGISESYDHAGNIYRVTFSPTAPSYDVLGAGASQDLTHDLSSGIYVYLSLGPKGSVPVDPLPASDLTSESASRQILRY